MELGFGVADIIDINLILWIQYYECDVTNIDSSYKYPFVLGIFRKIAGSKKSVIWDSSTVLTFAA